MTTPWQFVPLRLDLLYGRDRWRRWRRPSRCMAEVYNHCRLGRKEYGTEVCATWFPVAVWQDILWVLNLLGRYLSTLPTASRFSNKQNRLALAAIRFKLMHRKLCIIIAGINSYFLVPSQIPLSLVFFYPLPLLECTALCPLHFQGCSWICSHGVGEKSLCGRNLQIRKGRGKGKGISNA